MRKKDVQKEKAVIDATIKIVNKEGLNNASISKIAREAGVSQATIYIYYKNKEDLVLSIFYYVKEKITLFLYQDLDENNSVIQNLRILWNNTIKACSIIPEFTSYEEQFTNSPLCELIDGAKMKELAKLLYDLLERGIKEKIIKNIPLHIFIAFFMSPAISLSSRKMANRFTITEESISETFQIAFNAIKY